MPEEHAELSRLRTTWTTMSNTMDSDAIGAAIARTPWRRSTGEGVPRPLRGDEPFELPPAASAGAEFEMLVRRQLELLGEDPDRDGLLTTPERVAKALAWLTRGYDVDVHDGGRRRACSRRRTRTW